MSMLGKFCSGTVLTAALCVSSLGHAGTIKIEKIDCRAMTDLECQIDFDYGGNHYMDWQDYFGTWPDSTEIHWGVSTYSGNWLCSGGQCGGDGLYDEGANPTSGQRLLINKEDNPRVYDNLSLQCWFKINGDWHYDWEDIGSWSGGSDVNLVLDGCYASWDGGQWLGNLLRPGNPEQCHTC